MSANDGVTVTRAIGDDPRFAYYSMKVDLELYARSLKSSALTATTKGSLLGSEGSGTRRGREGESTKEDS